MRLREIAMLFAATCFLALAPSAQAHNYKYKVLYSFCSEANCADGSGPAASLLMDQAGNLFGTTQGGTPGATVFELILMHGTRWKHRTLYSFCSQANCADGNSPAGNLIVDTSGNLYGMTQRGGPYGTDAGTAFELLPTGTRWKFKQLYAFCAQQPCPDGNNPSGGLAYFGEAAGSPYDGTSALFGTAAAGGSGLFPLGVAFKLERQNNHWKQGILYSFCSLADCVDGATPNAPVLDSAGRLWGTTSSGGNDRGGGVLYSISGRQESVEYEFCSDTENCLDGAFPRTPVFLDNFGRIVGTTPLGGSDISNGFGTLFAVSGGSEQVLYTFCPRGRNCTHGEDPSSGVIEDASGNIFGMADDVVYEFSNGGEQVLYTFCSEANCTDGTGPSGGLIMDAAGNLYGTTQGGGANNAGTVFELEY